MTRTRMTMRMFLERNGSNATDENGLPIVSMGEVATVPCWAWMKTINRLSEENRLATITVLQAAVPIGTDIRRDDEVAQIQDRRERVKFTGRYIVENDPALRMDHLEVTMRRAA